tara:strand:+ start:133 stop:306 length:174 start_codon:yes stop_codon:yes gene_type:complete
MITRGCVRCKEAFEYNGDYGIGRGTMTKRYCEQCKILQHRDESREYQRRKKLNMCII